MVAEPLVLVCRRGVPGWPLLRSVAAAAAAPARRQPAHGQQGRPGQRAVSGREEKSGAWGSFKGDWRRVCIMGPMLMSMGQHTCSAARSFNILRLKIVTAIEETTRWSRNEC